MCVCQKQGIKTRTESSRAPTAFFRINCSAVLKPDADDCASEESARVPIMFGRHFTRASAQNRTLLGTTIRWELKECKVAQQSRNTQPQPELANGCVAFAKALQALPQAALQNGRRVGIERNQIPKWLAAILAQVGKRGGISIGMASDVFSNCCIRMSAEALQSSCI